VPFSEPLAESKNVFIAFATAAKTKSSCYDFKKYFRRKICRKNWRLATFWQNLNYNIGFLVIVNNNFNSIHSA
jgi:hypothetical protein